MALSRSEVETDLGISFPMLKDIKKEPLQTPAGDTPTETQLPQRFSRLKTVINFLKENANYTQEQADNEHWARLGLSIIDSAEQNPKPTQQYQRIEDINAFTSSILEEELGLTDKKNLRRREEVIVSFPAVNTSAQALQH